MTSCDVEQRFFFFLREHYGEKENIRTQLSKKNVADAIGTTPESISRMLTRLKSEGMASWEGDEIVLREGFWSKWFVE